MKAHSRVSEGNNQPRRWTLKRHQKITTADSGPIRDGVGGRGTRKQRHQKNLEKLWESITNRRRGEEGIFHVN